MADPEDKPLAVDPSKELRLMLAFFGEARLPLCAEVPAAAVPQPFHDLLVHTHHMTVTLEAYHRSKVRVRPYQVHRHGDLYGRKLDLLAETTGLVVMTGIMLINLSLCNDDVRQLIIAEQTPLGRILIEHNILREITTESFLRVRAADPLLARFALPTPLDAYGRIATIFCDGLPAVDLLEIVNPGL